MKTQLSTCRVCGKPVSERARKCPHCGETDPSQAALQVKTLAIITVMIGMAVLFYFIYGCVNAVFEPFEEVFFD